MKASLKQFVCIAPLSMILLIGISYAANDTQIGRYLSVPNKPLMAQKDLLRQTRQVTFPLLIDTVGEAINYLLLFSGYSLNHTPKTNRAVLAMLNAPLPEVDRQFGPMSLEDGLKTLSGNSFVLLIDPIHRLISFKLKSSSDDLYESVKSK